MFCGIDTLGSPPRQLFRLSNGQLASPMLSLGLGCPGMCRGLASHPDYASFPIDKGCAIAASSEIVGVEFGQGVPLVELEVDASGRAVEAELAPSAVVVLPTAMGVGEEIVGQLLDNILQ